MRRITRTHKEDESCSNETFLEKMVVIQSKKNGLPGINMYEHGVHPLRHGSSLDETNTA